MLGRGWWLLLLSAGAVSAVVVSASAMVAATDDPPHPSAGRAEVESHAVRLLRAWDARRARAYARGDEASLASLYVPGSRTGAADLEVLDGYLTRGLRVTGMSTQLLTAEVVRESSRRIELAVTDVLVDAAAVDDAGRSWALPHDQPTTRLVVLELRRGRWLVAEAYPAD